MAGKRTVRSKKAGFEPKEKAPGFRQEPSFSPGEEGLGGRPHLSRLAIVAVPLQLGDFGGSKEGEIFYDLAFR